MILRNRGNFQFSDIYTYRKNNCASELIGVEIGRYIFILCGKKRINKCLKRLLRVQVYFQMNHFYYPFLGVQTSMHFLASHCLGVRKLSFRTYSETETLQHLYQAEFNSKFKP